MITTNYALQPIKLTGQYEIASRPKTDKPIEVTPHHPCPHCGKPDWCCLIGSSTVWNSDRFHQPNYALGQAKQSQSLPGRRFCPASFAPISLLSNCQKLNNVQGGIA